MLNIQDNMFERFLFIPVMSWGVAKMLVLPAAAIATVIDPESLSLITKLGDGAISLLIMGAVSYFLWKEIKSLKRKISELDEENDKLRDQISELRVRNQMLELQHSVN